ncbi:AAA family ATPase [Lihuaxuella thermophila]|uniref:Nuclease SbcCD subunit C n=1 Tax=Lihuaxuella thermophila TaxID=1173111 RepID=A0A1H8GIT0_9BACL|nr:AAA family ATPase [Lihuaxuella thermophila]SEN43685.1 AAA ATPase domain-containing protein [Lihuaxuella thermophila]
MNCFKKLVIENFQSHVHTEIDFSQGLNVFVGPSDSGKSAILRALRWVLFNQPRGTDFIRTGAGKCRVSLTLTDGTEVIRVRGASVNRYILRTPDGEEKIFEGWGTGVPPEIAEAHRIQPVKLDQKEIYVHFGTQLESPFLLFESAQNKAKIIGRISGAHLIDNALKKTGSDRQTVNNEIKYLERQAEQLKEKLKPYENLSILEQALQQAEACYRESRAKKEKVERLKQLFDKLEAVRREQEVCLRVVQELQNIPDADRLLSELERKHLLYRQLARLREQRERVRAGKEICLEIIEKSQALPQVNEHLVSLEFKQERLVQLRRIKSRRDELDRQRKREKETLDKLARIPETAETIEKLQSQMVRRQQLIQLNGKWTTIQREKQKIKHVILVNREVPELLATILPGLEQKAERLRKLKAVYEKRTDVSWRIDKGKQFCKEKEKEMASLTDTWAELLIRLEKCPTCGSRINSSVIQHIMEEYRGGESHAAAGRED